MTWPPGRPRADRDVYRAIADPTRRGVLETLAKRGPLTVTGLSEAAGIEMPILSRHLAVLREADLVMHQQAGRQRVYRLRAEPLRELYYWAASFEEHWTEPPD